MFTAVLRASALVFALTVFFVIGAPLQWLIARYTPRAANAIPAVFCRCLLRLVGVDVSVEGARVTPGPVLAAANHVSWIDILALGSVAPFCFLAKREVAAWPIISAFANVQGTVFVDRKRRRSIPQANRDMAARMGEGRPVLLFPEGTTVDAREPGPFRSSHFAATRELLRTSEFYASADVQPIAIVYSRAEAAWVGDDALLPHLWRMLRAPTLRCAICYGAPIACTVATDRKAVARQARESVVAMLEAYRFASAPDAAADLAALAPSAAGR